MKMEEIYRRRTTLGCDRLIFHSFAFVVSRACGRGDGWWWIEGMEREIVVVSRGRRRGRWNGEAMGWGETSRAGGRSDRETDEKKNALSDKRRRTRGSSSAPSSRRRVWCDSNSTRLMSLSSTRCRRLSVRGMRVERTRRGV